MRKLQFPTILVLLLVVGLIVTTASPAAAGQMTERPFQVSLEAEFEMVGVCPSGAPLSHIEGSGTASHMGAIGAEGEQCLGEPGVVTWTAANGDEITILFITVLLAAPGEDGSAPFLMPALEVTGTGRFANVQLSDALAGTIWFKPDGSGHLVGSIDGTIIYDASEGRESARG